MPYQEGPASEDTRVYTISCEGELSFIEAGQDPSMWLAISVPILVPLLFWWTTLSLFAGFLLIRTHRAAISADGWGLVASPSWQWNSSGRGGASNELIYSGVM